MIAEVFQILADTVYQVFSGLFIGAEDLGQSLIQTSANLFQR